MEADETPFYETIAFTKTCLIFQSVVCGIIIPFEIYVVLYKMRLKMDPSALIVIFAYTFSFL